MLLLSVLLACGDKETTDTSTLDTSTSESVDTSIDQYKQIYCEEYAMRCNALRFEGRRLAFSHSTLR